MYTDTDTSEGPYMFKPSQTQSLAKARLYKNITNNPLLGDVEALSTQKLEKLSKVKDLSTWMTQEGFHAWFTNSNHIEDLMEADLELGMERLREVLTTPMGGEKGDVRASDITKAVEMLLKYTGREPKKEAKVEYKDAEVGQMDEERLDKMISKAFNAKEKVKQELELAVGE